MGFGMVCIPQRSQSRTSPPQELATEVASSDGIPFLDLSTTDAFRDKAATSLYFKNDIHLNQHGHQVCADLLKPLVEDLIDRARKGAEAWNADVAGR